MQGQFKALVVYTAACGQDFASKHILCVCSICIDISGLRAGRALKFIFAWGLHMSYIGLGCMYSATLVDLHHTAELSYLLILFVTFLSHHH